ncbi:decarboxylating 6-phosphogluconate dehydrogenase [Roseomonas alkaliterrae]|uniref:6-phosphogluconate dehydrogenase n=1 Tax=Neoroseomonas alkaliterrae TaxID=1452450 RepID=A0A840XQZ7_9PROT|nr:decarboxylating 6-phosphogluconate dehydrogenase [Neoroseomonas alkaliterrae]MBB5690336.1 6-phosphogluconate dehydrogenase [Neoroseomonas alkaliterrae]MBR0675965.1 decarboxylating 6-phosphogluconate dehydrogenase [Neoroseomonas alkaliterrae]
MAEIGIVGLGRMGANIARRLMRSGHRCVVWDRDPAAVAAVVADGAAGADDLAGVVAGLSAPRAVWVMLPHGAPTEEAIASLGGLLSPGDVAIDGGNTHWKDDVRRAADLRAKGIHYLDIGTSGGVWGLERGYCLMIGGEAEPVARLAPIFAALAPGRGSIPATPRREGRAPNVEEGWLHCGGHGAGHLVKMVHNGIEYGMMQALAEGLDLLRHADSPDLPQEHRITVDIADVAEVWRRGSVITSWLLDLTAAALAEDPELAKYSGRVGDSGEGRWTVQQAVETAVSAPVLTAALYARFASRDEGRFAGKALSAMRAGFGGHLEPKQG